jgi:hypothetical protein
MILKMTHYYKTEIFFYNTHNKIIMGFDGHAIIIYKVCKLWHRHAVI